MSTETDQPKTKSAAAVASSDGLDTKRYNQFAWWTDSGGWTIIGDHDCHKLARFVRTLSEAEVALWCDGYEAGERRGIEQGKIIKSGEIRRALGV